MRLSNFFMAEMARTAGSIDKRTRAALEMARQSGNEFSVKDFCQWLMDAGADNADPRSVNQRLKRLAADPELGERPNALKPLVVTRAGRTGPGGTGLFRYVFDGAAGAPIKSKEKPPADPNADIPYADDDDVEADDAPEEPAPQPARPSMPPNLLPKADPNGDWQEESMAALGEMGYGTDNPIWPKIAKAENDMGVAKVMSQEGVPPMVRTKMIRIAKYIFNRMGKDWETGGVAAPEPAQTHAGDREYKKGWQGKPKQPLEYEPTPDDDDDGGEFIDAEPEEDPVTAKQAGATNFVKPEPPAAPPAAPASAKQEPQKHATTAKSVAQLMKRFKK